MAVTREDLSKLRQKFASDFNLLQDKFDNLIKLLKVRNDNNKAMKQRVTDLEEKINNSENVSQEDDDRINIDDEITKLKYEEVKNAKDIKEIEARLLCLETEQQGLKETINENKNSTEKCQKEIENISQKLSDVVNLEQNQGNLTVPWICCKVCKEKFTSTENLKRHIKSEHMKKGIVCSLCEDEFGDKYRLEEHLVKVHQKFKKFECSNCDKKFLLKWRLQKHMNIHSETKKRMCHYFNNEKHCPFEEMGCKFVHKESQECRMKSTCIRTMCQFRH